MSRKLSPSMIAIQPGTIRLEYPDGKDDWAYTRKLCKQNAAFEPGDLVPFLDDGQVCQGLVIGLFPEYFERRDGYLMRYRVRVQRADKEYGKQWRYISPGEISRGFEAEAAV